MEAFVENHLKLLELERQEEISSSQSLLSASPKVLTAKGLCLPKMRLFGIRTGLYGRTLAEFECAPHREMPANTFSTGDLVGIRPEKAPVGDTSTSVSSVLLRMAPRGVVLALDDATEGEGLDEEGSFRLVKLGSDVTYRRIKKGLQQLLTKAKDGPAAHLVEVLFGSVAPAPTPPLPELTFLNEGLDDSQREAVAVALARPDVAIIHGPPGTGKTTTLVELLRQAVGQRKMRVLASAPSNVAVDNLLERLSCVKPKLRLVRLGHAARVSAHLQAFSLDAQLSRSDAWQLVADVRREMDATRRRLASRGGVTDAFRLRQQLAELRRELRSREAKALTEIFGNSDVVLCTLTGLHEAKALRDVAFDLAVIDECSQSVEAACWLALMRASRCVLAGDHLQLPPTVVSREAAAEGLELSLMERLLTMWPGEAVTRMLTVQYRMHEAIMKWSGEEFYESRLTAHESVRKHCLLDLPHSSVADNSEEELGAPLLLLDTAGCSLNECSLELSRGNIGEADLVAKVVEERVSDWGLLEEQVGVITPYNLQVELIRNRVKPSRPGVEVRTVDGFQGREKEIIILSLVRSNDKGEVGFLAEHRRLNVAVTRARRQLVVVCDSETLSRSDDKVIRNFVAFLQSEACVRSAQELMQTSDMDIGAPRPEDAFSLETSAGPASSSQGAKKAKQKQKFKKSAAEGPTKPRTANDKKVVEGRKPLPEADFADEVQAFFLSNDIEKIFPDSLAPFQRAAIHEIAERLGLIHESIGEGKSRHLVLRKRKDEKEEEEKQEEEEAEDEEEEEEEEENERKEAKAGKKKRNRKKKKKIKKQEEKEEEKNTNEKEEEKETNKTEEVPGKETEDPILRQLQEYRERQRTLRQPAAFEKDRKERKAVKKDLGTQLAALDGDDFDALVAAARASDSHCAASGCRELLSILGRRCAHCGATFCGRHALPEAHGCGAAAKQASRRPRPAPPGASAAIRRAQLQHRMDRKLGELATERKRKEKEKEQ